MASSGIARLCRLRRLLLGRHPSEQGGDSRANGRPVKWEREFFSLAGTVLRCRMDDANGHHDKFGCLLGEIDYGLEMHLVLREAGMLPAQRLARCAARLFASRSIADRM
jgi:hypothetical protein